MAAAPAVLALPKLPGDDAGLDEAKGQSQFSAHLSFNSARGNENREKLRSKLVDVGHRFVGFDKVLEQETIKRKGAEQTRLSTVSETLVKLEKAMNSEVKRRVDANKQVQKFTETLANDMLDRLQSNIILRIDKLTTSTETLTFRCTALEQGIAQFRGELPTKLQVDTAALVKELSQLREQMQLDKQARIERDTALLRRIAEIESSESAKFEQGMQTLQRDVDSCKAQVEDFARTEEGNDTRVEKFHAFILEEIAGMKNTLAVAAQMREQNDDETVQAMNQYTNALQKGLHTANKR